MFRLLNRFLGGSSVPKAASKRRTVRLELERLDERILLSNTGSVSEVFANQGNVVFYIGQDNNLYESLNGAPGQRLDNCHCDQWVSAGTDAFGNAVAYVSNTYTWLWAVNTSATNNGIPYITSEEAIAPNVASFSAAMGWVPIPNSGGWATKGGVYLIANGYDALWESWYQGLFGHFQIISGCRWCDGGISAGTDQYGYSVVYVLNHNRDVYERYSDGSWSGNLTNCGCTTVLVGSVNGYWYTNDDLHDVFIHNGNQYHFLASGITWQISAGTDRFGNSTLMMIWHDDNWPYWNYLSEYDVVYGWNYKNIQVMYGIPEEVAAGSNGYDYYTNPARDLHVIDPWANDWVIGWNVQ